MNTSMNESNAPESTNASVVPLSAIELIEQRHLTFAFEIRDSDGDTEISMEFHNGTRFARVMAIEAGNFVNTGDQIQFMQWAIGAMAAEALRANGEYSIERTVQMVESFRYTSGPWSVRFVES